MRDKLEITITHNTHTRLENTKEIRESRSHEAKCWDSSSQSIRLHLKVQDASSRLAEATDWRPCDPGPCLAVRSRRAPASLPVTGSRAPQRPLAPPAEPSARDALQTPDWSKAQSRAGSKAISDGGRDRCRDALQTPDYQRSRHRSRYRSRCPRP